ncbi:hypothetical protein CANCADRAFT_57501 [Tortispora caseinolytica NRRL Y-17796]|uniref:Flap endonuclease 1 n=1 Tax=Tortispora caseinolytica NRRL Y-17796 TaxID=767744 RepID=A0A1E4THF0_9ASCO|nr:hypothetical protein CANCADRAFT_57501 [Tortispora caseinolytica NRRL Y-17796]
MGIKGLNRLISEHAPNAIKTGEMKQFAGRKVAIDASMSLYQFLINVRQQDGSQLTNEAGETTSHLVGLFSRTVRMVSNGLKPLYVFDGKPPVLKSQELGKRLAKRQEAEKAAEDATKEGKVEDYDKFARRTVKVTREQNEEAKELLRLMGIPYIEAPCEAEAQCAELARSGKVYAAASEDMDTLCFGAPVLLRHLTFSEQKKVPVTELFLDKALRGLDMDMDTFVDLCILLGCDYLDTIPGIGPVTALKLLREHKNLEGVIEHLKSSSSKSKVPEDWPYQDARELFRNHDVMKGSECEISWKKPDVDGLIEFLVAKRGFSEDRVRSAAEKLAKGVSQGYQGRLDGFFKKKPVSEGTEKRRGVSGKNNAAKKQKK